MIFIYDTKEEKIKTEVCDIENIQKFEKDSNEIYGEFWSYDYWDLLNTIFEYYEDDVNILISIVSDSKHIIKGL